MKTYMSRREICVKSAGVLNKPWRLLVTEMFIKNGEGTLNILLRKWFETWVLVMYNYRSGDWSRYHIGKRKTKEMEKLECKWSGKRLRGVELKLQSSGLECDYFLNFFRIQI